MARQVRNPLLGNSHRWPRYADSGDHPAPVVSYRRGDTSHSLFALLVVNRITLARNLPEVHLEIRGRGQGLACERLELRALEVRLKLGGCEKREDRLADPSAIRGVTLAHCRRNPERASAFDFGDIDDVGGIEHAEVRGLTRDGGQLLQRRMRMALELEPLGRK